MTKRHRCGDTGLARINNPPILGSQPAQIEKIHIEGVLALVQWNKNTAAKILGISLKTLYTKIQQYNLVKE